MQISRSLRRITMVVALGLTLGACAGGRTLGEYWDDKSITAQVKTALIQDPEVSGMAIQVEAFKGVLQLSGFAENYAEAARAEQVAKGVKGVKVVKNDILLK